jgi:hypothetical protein
MSLSRIETTVRRGSGGCRDSCPAAPLGEETRQPGIAIKRPEIGYNVDSPAGHRRGGWAGGAALAPGESEANCTCGIVGIDLSLYS